MKISLSQKLNQPYVDSNLNTNQINKLGTTKNHTVAFKSLSGYLGGKVVIASTISGVKSSQVNKFKKGFADLLNNSKNYENYDIATKIIQLGKTPNNVDHKINPISFLVNVFTGTTFSIEDLKTETLSRLSQFDDNDNSIRIAKKSFINSLFESGDYAKDGFADDLKKMSNLYYGNLKQELADKVLYTPAQHRLKDCPEQYLYNFKLIQALDDGSGAHDNYFIKNINAIKQLLQLSNSTALKQLTQERNKAFAYYSHMFVFDGYDDRIEYNKDMWRKALEEQFNINLKKSENNSKKLSELLNINEGLAIEILKDDKALSDIEKSNNPEEKQKILIKRIYEKFNTKTIVFTDSWDQNADYRNLRIKLYSIICLVKRSKLNDEENVKKIFDHFKKQFDKLDSDLEYAAMTRGPGASLLTDPYSESFLDERLTTL